ncbi:MAG: 16S rRNA (cytosine(967)-C(5))-methyltransferase RsmB [Steroidobacteraceae bacterium]
MSSSSTAGAAARRRARSGRGGAGSGAAPGRFAPGAETLAAAVHAVAAVTQAGQSADDALLAAETRVDRAAVRAITLGTIRWYLRLVPLLTELVSRPPQELEPLLRALLVTAAHQVEYSRSAPEVSVHLAVDAARALDLGRSAGLVNAVLRRFVRERAERFAVLDTDPAVCHAHPAWLVEALAAAWPAELETMLAAANRHPPMTLRIDLSRGTVAGYLEELAAAGHDAQALSWRPGAVQLERPAPVGALPGFREGRVSVQDAGAQLAAPLLDLQPGQRVLDACAAPGGKTGHILELAPQLGELVAVDIEPRRMAMVDDTLRRLGRRASCRVADLRQPGALREAGRFERVLVDAPCSSSGVIRRHPDIKLLRRAGDIEALAQSQRAILDAAFEALLPGGRLVYATCSLLPRENEAPVRELLATRPDAELLPWPAEVVLPPGARRLELGVQLLPGVEADTDGFYYACLGRRSR